MSDAEKNEAIREEIRAEVKAAMAKTSFWVTSLYRIGIGICVAATLTIVKAGSTGAVSFYSEHQDLRKEMAAHNLVHQKQLVTDSLQFDSLTRINRHLLTVEADVNVNRNEIINLKFK